MQSQRWLHRYLVLLSSATVLFSFFFFQLDAVDWKWVTPLLLLCFVAERFKVQIFLYRSKESIAVSWAMVLSGGALCSLGLAEGLLVAIMSGLVSSMYPRRLPLIKLTYNVSANAFSAGMTGLLLMFLQFNGGLLGDGTIVTVVTCLCVSLFYMTVNYFCGIMLMKILTGRRYGGIVYDMIGPHIPHSTMLVFIGAMFGAPYRDFGLYSLLFCGVWIGLLTFSLKTTSIAAMRRIQELEESRRELEEIASKLDQAFEEFIQTLTATIDARDPYMYGHSMQVSNYAQALAAHLNLDQDEIKRIRIAGLLHDIGKISIPETILFKKGSLTNDEYEVIKRHAKIGEEIVEQISSLAEVARLVGLHHERFDGKGYPYGLQHEDIPIGAYILAVSDTLDTMLSNRSYKKGSTVQEAMEEFARCKGTQFHPQVVEALFTLRRELGDDVFRNSALLIDQSVIVGKLKTRPEIR